MALKIYIYPALTCLRLAKKNPLSNEFYYQPPLSPPSPLFFPSQTQAPYATSLRPAANLVSGSVPVVGGGVGGVGGGCDKGVSKGEGAGYLQPPPVSPPPPPLPLPPWSELARRSASSPRKPNPAISRDTRRVGWRRAGAGFRCEGGGIGRGVRGGVPRLSPPKPSDPPRVWDSEPAPSRIFWGLRTVIQQRKYESAGLETPFLSGHWRDALGIFLCRPPGDRCACFDVRTEDGEVFAGRCVGDRTVFSI